MKNPLLDAYNQVLTEQAEKPGVSAPSKAKPAPESTLTNPSKQTVGDLNNDDELFGEKPEMAKNCGPEGVKLEKTPAAKSTADYYPSNKPTKPVKAGENTPKVEEPAEEKEETSQTDKKFVPFKKKEAKEFKESMKPVSAFETLFKKTLVEEFGEEIPDGLSDDLESAPEDIDTEELEDDESPEVDDEEEETDEVGDLVADLNDLKAKIEAILDKVGGDLEDGEEIEPMPEESGEYTEDDFNEEFEDDDDEEGAVKESVKASKLAASKGKKLMSKSNKVGKLAAKGGKASTGKLRCEPKPKALGQKGSKLQGAKSKPEVKSSVKKGDSFFK